MTETTPAATTKAAVADLLTRLGYPAREANDLPDSPLRFPDGAQYRTEIPSVEGPSPGAHLDEERVERVRVGDSVGREPRQRP